MFEEVLESQARNVVQRLAPLLSDFYLAGGTAFALQMGHRRSLDFDFFSPEPFDTENLITQLSGATLLSAQRGTLHVDVEGVKFSFLYYSEPLLFPCLHWRGIRVADWKDILPEKFKTLSQRGAKKDFYDLYAAIQLRVSIEEACRLFVQRFSRKRINLYHLLKSLLFFEDADTDPPPSLLKEGKEWEWDQIKSFFVEQIQTFEKTLLGQF